MPQVTKLLWVNFFTSDSWYNICLHFQLDLTTIAIDKSPVRIITCVHDNSQKLINTDHLASLRHSPVRTGPCSEVYMCVSN